MCWRTWPRSIRSPRKVLEYRQLAKLKGTYVDALPALIDPATGRAAHHVQPGRRGHRAAVVVESEPAEHPDPHRAGPRDPRGVRAAARLEADRRRLFADRAAAAGPHVARSGAGGGVPQRRGYPHPHRRRSVRRPAADDHARAAPQREGRQLRHRLRADAVRAGASSWASIARKPSCTSAPTSSATRACAGSSTRPSPRSAAPAWR